MMTQAQLVLNEMSKNDDANHGITRAIGNAMEVLNLAGVILRLRNDGYVIRTVPKIDRFGRRYVKYVMPTEVRASARLDVQRVNTEAA